MLNKHTWQVLFLAFLATASFATTSLTPCVSPKHDGVPYERTRLRKLATDRLQEPLPMFQNDTEFEQLTCIGFNPVLNLLSATIEVKLPAGFNGGLCTNGSFEYVRFWVDYGSGWNVIGLASVNTHDIADSIDCAGNSTKPLYYTLSIKFQPDQKQCEIPVLPRIRATLSWYYVPSDDPYYTPIWGNTLEETIQSLATQPEAITGVVFTGRGLNSSIDHTGSAGSCGERDSEGYARDQRVFRAHDANLHHDLDVGPNIVFEELTCLGLDWAYNSLVATVRVKHRRGYLATPCQDDSFEYVSFWADWGSDANCSWTFLGTTRFNVHDFQSAPSTGLVYTAVMPVDVLRFSAPCNQTKIFRVRAALAFNEIPPQPPALPPRGNFIETHVHLQPFNEVIVPTIPQIRLIGNVPIQQIETTPGSLTSGMTFPNAMISGSGFADPSGQHSRPCPFGGLITVRGEPFVGHAYRLMVRPYPPPDPTYPGLPVMDPINVIDVTLINPYLTIYPTSDGYFIYRPQLQNFENILSDWSPRQGSWQIRLEMATVNGHVHEGYTPWYMVVANQLDPASTGPVAYLDIFGTECLDLRDGDIVSGTFYATSAYFDHWDFEVFPASLNPNTVTTGLDPLMPVLPPGKTWNLVTVGAKPCGYVVRLQVWDRTVVNGNAAIRYNTFLDKGFCLLQLLII